MLTMSTKTTSRTEILCRAVFSYRLSDLDPHLPKVTLERVLPEDQGGSASWDAWLEHYESLALEGYNEDTGLEEWIRVRLGALSLPREILLGAHKRIFGSLTEHPTEFAITVLATALFTTYSSYSFDRHKLINLYEKARFEQKRRLKLEADIKGLLTALEA